MLNDTVSLAAMQNATAAPVLPTFIQTNLISDGSQPGTQTDPNLVNPWGISFNGATGPLWISDNGTGITSVDTIQGATVTLNVIPAVTVASPTTTPSTPTGQVFNAFPNAFMLSDGTPATFLFATEDGTIAGWNQALGAKSTIAVNNSTDLTQGDVPLKVGAVYKGLAIGMSATGPTLYAANFRHGTVDMFDQNFKPTGSFTDPTVPVGFAPFNVQVLGSTLYVAFAQQDAQKQGDVAGAGHGFVDAFDLQGKMLGRVGSAGSLDSPWGLAIAPPTFGSFAGDLLVGNFGDGKINVYNPTTDQFLGQLNDSTGKPIAISRLWALAPGNGGAGGDANTIYFTAGPASETHGLFGSLIAAPAA